VAEPSPVVEEVPTLSLGEGTPAPTPVFSDLGSAPVAPEPQPAPTGPEAEPEEPEPEPEPGPASHLEELPPQGTQLRVPTSATAAFEAMPTFADGRTFEPPAFEGPPPNRFAALPPWARLAVPVAVVVVLLLAVLLLA
jgi:hypothetical protein